MTLPGATPGNRSCFAVTVLDDDLVEPTENFILSLTTGDAAIRITNSATGVIYDNDGNGVLQDVLVNCYVLYFSVAVVSMVLQSYSVQEESGSVEVCAELESGDLQRVQPIVQLTTQSGTASDSS